MKLFIGIQDSGAVPDTSTNGSEIGSTGAKGIVENRQCGSRIVKEALVRANDNVSFEEYRLAA